MAKLIPVHPHTPRVTQLAKVAAVAVDTRRRSTPALFCRGRLGLTASCAAAANVLDRRSRQLRRGRRESLQTRALNEVEANGVECATLDVPVRHGQQLIKLKRFMGTVRGSDLTRIPKLLPAILVIHSGPGSSSRYLEPLAWRVCEQVGRACYLYDQLGRGVLNRTTLKYDTRDLHDVACYLAEELGEPEVHVIGHGFGGVLLMEALVKRQLWGCGKSEILPRLRSVCLMGTPSSSCTLQKEARRLFQLAQEQSSQGNGATLFWYRHYCSLRSLSCLTNAYASADEAPLGGWEPWETWVLRGWEITRSEVCKNYAKSTGSAPLLSVRGEDDFVTEACVEAWRAARESLRAAALEGDGPTTWSTAFSEEVIPGCGHNMHLEDPGALWSLLSGWLMQVEEPQEAFPSQL